jgi:putative NADPH-quinone reductase
VRVVVVFAHPGVDSFGRAICDTVVRSAEAAGHEVRELDLYRLGFRAEMTADERRAYHDRQPIIDAALQPHVDAVRWAEALVFVYPTWWSSMPAIMKGWLERVMVPGVGFVFDETGRVRPGMHHVRRIAGFSTYGGSWLTTRLVNDNGRRILMRALRISTGLRTRSTWRALYGMDDATDAERAAFLRRCERAVARW